MLNHFEKNQDLYESLPYEYGENRHKPSNLWGKLTPPYPTNKWWLNLVMGNGDAPIYPYPYTAAAKNSGLAFWYPDKIVQKDRVYLSYKNEWLIGSKSEFVDRRIVCYDDLTVTFAWLTSTSNSDSDMLSGYMKVPFLKGSPYMSAFYYNLTLLFKFTSIAIKSLENIYNNISYIVTLNDDSKWAIFFTQPCVIILDGQNQISSNTSYTGYVRFAFIPEMLLNNDNELVSGHFNTLFAHSLAIPVASTVKFLDNSIIHEYSVSSTSQADKLLLLTLPHHTENLKNPNRPIYPIKYDTLRGQMLGVLGNRWEIFYSRLSGITFFEEKQIPYEFVEIIKSSLLAETLDFAPKESDNSIYFRGKELARFARLALIAYQLGDLDKALNIANSLKSCIQYWLDSRGSNKLIYDTIWGGIVTKHGLADQGADFGNSMYNDHHFHYGHYIYAVSVILFLFGTNDPWFSQYKSRIFALVQDYTNSDLHSKYFTPFRHMDFFDGNSWANGLHVFENSRNQESTSESVNAYYSAYLFYHCVGDLYSANIMNLLLTSEILSSQYYWHTGSQSKQIYPHEFSSNCIVGVLWENSAEFTTWFGNNPEYIYGIQMLPFTPISMALLNSEWLRHSWKVIKRNTIDCNPKISCEWKGLLLMAGAIVDPSITIDDINSLTSFDNGNSRTNALWWLSICRS
ncbi:Endo-1,3(4)-beta-glucanase 1 [Smittium culicis]|uniref:glucan endo-1,3-beta-D-glucosidase n=1 Tax=Smittium culicis TaxID=133412 RepID=A0A1R1YLQ7_9FUNG|nr:Endo-1,3(4)-beta-glucanase 1 [Smittium culicis]